jgi:cob(I)alamin adenosyltransferase
MMRTGSSVEKMKTFNKKGDAGETSLLFNIRVAKDSLYCEAYGTLDEAVSCLGVARNAVSKEKTRNIILEIQQELFVVGAELATRLEDHEKLIQQYKYVNENMVARLEKLVNEIESDIAPPRSFVIPGGNAGSAFLDLSRSTIRRAERRVVTLKRNKLLNNEAIMRYLNRLADLLYILARYEEA